jgi:hypothetical protein
MKEAGCQWHLATQEEEIVRTAVQNQPGQIALETHHKKRAGGVAQGVDPDFKPQYCKKKKKA